MYRSASIRACTLLAIVATACGGSDSIVGPVDEVALTAELEDAFSVFRSLALNEVGRAVLYNAVLGGHGASAIESNAGAVFRWNLAGQRYERTAEQGPAEGVRFVLYSALEAVREGAPLIETGSVDYLVRAEGIRAILLTELGHRLQIDFSGEVAPMGAPHAWEITGQVDRAGRTHEFRFIATVTADAEGTSVRSVSWRGPDGLSVAYTAHTTRITVHGGETSAQELTIRSRNGRASMTGFTVGGTGDHEMSFSAQPIAAIHQLSELRPDFIEYIRPVDGEELSAAELDAVRQVFRVRNHLSTGMIPIVFQIL